MNLINCERQPRAAAIARLQPRILAREPAPLAPARKRSAARTAALRGRGRAAGSDPNALSVAEDLQGFSAITAPAAPRALDSYTAGYGFEVSPAIAFHRWDQGGPGDDTGARCSWAPTAW